MKIITGRDNYSLLKLIDYVIENLIELNDVVVEIETCLSVLSNELSNIVY